MVIVTLSNVLAFLIVLPLMVFYWRPLLSGHAALFTLAGFLGTCGHLCLAWAYSRAHAGRLGILEYTAFIWGSFFGYVLFAEVPTAWTVGGAVLIVVACVFAAMGRRPDRAVTVTEELGR